MPQARTEALAGHSSWPQPAAAARRSSMCAFTKMLKFRKKYTTKEMAAVTGVRGYGI
jgi:hypothetical protein